MLPAGALQDLITRCRFAQAYGYEVASAEDYARKLGYAGEDPPYKVKKFSPAHLLYLARHSAPAGPAPKEEEPKASPPETEPETRNSDRPTSPVDIRVLHAALQAMKPKMWELVLIDVGESPIGLVRQLREVLGMGLRSLESAVSGTLPEVLKSGLTQSEAESLQARLRTSGASFQIRQSEN